MAGFAATTNKAASLATRTQDRKSAPPSDANDGGSSDASSSSPPPSTVSSSSELDRLDGTTTTASITTTTTAAAETTTTAITTATTTRTTTTTGTATAVAILPKKVKSLQERGKIPWSFYVTYGSILTLQCSSGVWSSGTLLSWWSSLTTSARGCYEIMGYLSQLCRSLWVMMIMRTTISDGELPDTDYSYEWTVYARTLFTAVGVGFPLYVFFVAPFRAGLWTGPRSRKHVVHRYMGLVFLIQYTLAWVEYATSYDRAATTSFLPHTVAVNGIIQSSSAYFSFKVLPELGDAGFYSDRAVLSRNFVHENIFFATMTIFGSVYYNDALRPVLRSNAAGRITELIFVFWPYVLIRPFYPITRFKNAGSTRGGRSDQNRRFYEVSTTAVKIFFLWAKYFLGFFINFLVYLDGMEHWRMVRGMLLLNTGTVSLAIFLHTLRFKKVLPPRFTFSVYLMQIYATFTALPTALEMFRSHPALCALCLAGLLCNMTRNRKVHAAWCMCSMILLNLDSIEW